MLPIIPISVLQCMVCYIIAIILGLSVTINILYAILFIIPISILYISMGLLCGSVMNDKHGRCNCEALLTNISAWLFGIWFNLELVGGTFKSIAYALPFVHTVDIERAVLSGNFIDIFPHVWWVFGYSVVILASSIFLFLRQMKEQ